MTESNWCLRAKLGARWGGLFAGIYAIIALSVLVIRRPGPFETNNSTPITAASAYAIGGALAGVVVGLLLPLARTLR